MNYYSIGIGLFSLGVGLYTLFQREKNPDRFLKLTRMKKVYGEKTGNFVHLVGYSIIPIMFGVLMLVLGFLGKGFRIIMGII